MKVTGKNNKQMRKMFMSEKQDDAMDKKQGIKEGSKKDSALDTKRGITEDKPLIKPSRKGLLHKKLGVAKDKKIPAAKINKALKSNSPALRKEANFAKNFRKK